MNKSMKTSFEERRRGIRARRILSIRHRLYKRENHLAKTEPWFLSMTENMSYNGVLFTSSAAYLKGDIIELEVILSGVLDIFRGYGRVVRVDKKPSGVVYSVAVTLVDLKDKPKSSPKLTRRKISIKPSKRK